MKQIVVISLIAIIALFMIVLFTTRTHAETMTEPRGMVPVSSSAFLKVINAPVGLQVKELTQDQYPAFEKKFADGVTNVATSWTQIPQKVVKVSNDDNILAGTTVGLGEGIVSGVERAAIGTIEIVTTPIAPNQVSSLKAQYKVAHPEEGGWEFDIVRW
jgi:putative exosortase-associated protein (TIGR04073 family)